MRIKYQFYPRRADNSRYEAYDGKCVFKCGQYVNPSTPKDLQRRRRATSPLKIKTPSENMRESQQIHQLFIQFINYIWLFLRVSELHCHLQGAFLVPSERCSTEEQSIEFCGWALLDTTRPSTIFYRLFLN
jgi:hypothetical protein